MAKIKFGPPIPMEQLTVLRHLIPPAALPKNFGHLPPEERVATELRILWRLEGRTPCIDCGGEANIYHLEVDDYWICTSCDNKRVEAARERARLRREAEGEQRATIAPRPTLEQQLAEYHKEQLARGGTRRAAVPWNDPEKRSRAKKGR